MCKTLRKRYTFIKTGVERVVSYLPLSHIAAQVGLYMHLLVFYYYFVVFRYLFDDVHGRRFVFCST